MKNYLNFSTRKTSLLTLVVFGIATIILLGGCAPAGWGGYGHGHPGWGSAPMMSGQGAPGEYCGGYYPGPGQNGGSLWNTPAQSSPNTQ